MTEPEKEPKIIVDSDWKEQVAKEKEAAKVENLAAVDDTPRPSGDVAEQPGDRGTTETATRADEELPPPPEASFVILVSMLFTQAMATLGQMPDPVDGETKINKPYAKHYIDTLEMLGEKTAGNLTDDESKMLSEALHALRMTYVNVKA